MDGQDDAPDGWKAVRIDGFANHIGPLLRTTGTDAARAYGLRTSEVHRNLLGLVHGGVLTSLLDQVLAIVAWTAADRAPTVTVQMDTRFLGAARPGDFLEARATLRHATQSLLFLDAEVTVGPAPVASASAIMKISRKAGQPA